jgi:hypothetical protein
MLLNVIVFLATTGLTFLYGVLRKKMNAKKDNQFLFKFYGYYLHHSLLGLFLIVLPLFGLSDMLYFVGIGIVIGHGFEEIYFGKKDLQTFFIFISK